MNILSIITFIRPKDGQKLCQPAEYKQRGTIGLKLIRQVMSHPLATCLFQSRAGASFAPSTYAPIAQSTLLIPSSHWCRLAVPSITDLLISVSIHRYSLHFYPIYQSFRSIISFACSCVLLRMLHGPCPCIRQVFDELSATTLGFWLVEGVSWAFRHGGGGHFHSVTVCVMPVHTTSVAAACLYECI